ncbi:hypothetical protein RHSIM_Rhsim02G0249400 [Rhododendron simsii]|uniref:KIB1-4 beta-propeller domain-containing protein n=1 Tax=Rhododendron simsii TaxID=118357 RepID=A0A834LVV2_RHOSS|nr:hypothetical protein RHSIM_Rhsim02G0249400 [Rhododendron simsii]
MSEQGEMSLIHPMSRVKIDLPHQNTFKYADDGGEEDKRVYQQKAVLSSCPSSTDEYVHMGQFYGVNSSGDVFRCGVGGPDLTMARRVGAIPSKTLGGTYLVELLGRLPVVVRDGYDLNSLPEFQVFEVDINSNWTWAQITTLGDYALFLGENASIAADVSKFVGVKPNCTYCSDDNWEAYNHLKHRGGKDMGIYNLEDRTRMPHYNSKESLNRASPPIRITPSFF